VIRAAVVLGSARASAHAGVTRSGLTRVRAATEAQPDSGARQTELLDRHRLEGASLDPAEHGRAHADGRGSRVDAEASSETCVPNIRPDRHADRASDVPRTDLAADSVRHPRIVASPTYLRLIACGRQAPGTTEATLRAPTCRS
jgi:hypothetical protein